MVKHSKNQLTMVGNYCCLSWKKPHYLLYVWLTVRHQVPTSGLSPAEDHPHLLCFIPRTPTCWLSCSITLGESEVSVSITPTCRTGTAAPASPPPWPVQEFQHDMQTFKITYTRWPIILVCPRLRWFWGLLGHWTASAQDRKVSGELKSGHC